MQAKAKKEFATRKDAENQYHSHDLLNQKHQKILAEGEMKQKELNRLIEVDKQVKHKCKYKLN